MIDRILIGGVIVAIGIALLYPSVVPHRTTLVSVFYDITDSQKAKPVLEDIEPFYGLEKNQNSGAMFRYANVTDVSLNATKVKTLPDINPWTSNEFERTKSISDFFAFIKESLSVIEDNGKNRSSVYLPIARELTVISNDKADEKNFIVYSDLMENTPEVSFYDPKTFQELISSPETFIERFNKLSNLPDLTGIHIFLIYQPSNTKADEEYRTVSSFYKKLLETKGATVHIQANL